MKPIPCPREMSKVELTAEVVRRFGRVRLRVVGSSMLPAIQPGDELMVRRCGPDGLRIGEIVVFTRGGRLFAHRLVAVHASGLLETKGDTIEQPDPFVHPGELLGRADRVSRRGDICRLPASSGFAGRLAAALFRRSISAVRIFTRLQALRGGA